MERPLAMEFEFKLTYQLLGISDSNHLMMRLSEEGCTDALVGLGVAGQVGLYFVREASTAEEAILSALEDVKRALPDANLIEANKALDEPKSMTITGG